MKSWKTPTPEQVDRAVALIGHAEQYRYFFDRLENPEWVLPLKSKGFFHNPPKPQHDEARGTIGFPPWPESRYLARVAFLRPELVRDIILEIPETENVRVYEDLADALLNMPTELAAQLLEKAKTWARSPYQSILPEKLSKLVAHLAKGGKVNEALDLARILLEILPDPKYERKTEKEEIYRLSPQPRARFDTWHYEQILKKDFPELVKAGGIRVFNLLCDLLETTIRLSRRRDDDEGPEDYSYIWRRAVEDHEQNQHHGLNDILVSAVRDAAELIAQTNMSNVAELVSILESRPWRIFHRVALYLLGRFPSAEPDLLAAHLTNRSWFDNVGVRHEYAVLIAEQFGRLTQEQRQVILGWIEQGPNLEKFKESENQSTGKWPTDEVANRYRKIWQRDRLAWFKTQLPEDWRHRYDTLVAECGEPEHPDFPAWVSSGWVGPTSPKSAEDLKAMSIPQLVTFLQTWRPPDDHFAPSPEGLGRQLTTIISEDPVRFAQGAQQFQGLDPTYVRSAIRGIEEACKAKKTFDWTSILQLCHWIVTQPREIPGRQVTRGDADLDWGGSRQAVARLLSSGFDEEAVEIPSGLKQQVWEVLKPLTDDPEPIPEYEAQYGGSNMDPATLSINTVRGEAMHTVIRYALWARRHLEKLPNSKEKLARGFEEMPEVREVLDKHLELSRDPSLAVRAVYGQWFPWLALLDRNWARDRVSKIFPLDESQRALRDAAWETYIIFCHPYDDVLEVLRDQYAFAVEHVETEAEEKRQLDDPDRHLAEHLMTFYWRGKLDLDDPEGLLAKFWQKVSDGLRSYALEFIGRSLYHTKDPVPSKILQRAKLQWERRLAIAKGTSKPAEHKGEMAAFGWWFISGKFDDNWAFNQLAEALKIAGKIDPDHIVVERLAALVNVMPKQAVQCLEAIVKGDREGWGIYGWQEHARTILTTALRSADSEAATSAENLIHYLGSKGYFEFRDLL
jgi:hypothetical protein